MALESFLRLKPVLSGKPPSLSDFARKVFQPGLKTFFRLCARLKPKADEELIHDLRVCARRLVEYLDILSLEAPSLPLRQSRGFLGDFIGLLSPIRNSDVSRRLLREALEKNPPKEEQEAILTLNRAFKKRRKRKLTLALDFSRRRDFADYSEKLEGLGVRLSSQNKKTMTRFLRTPGGHMELRVSQAARQLRKTGKGSTDKDLHRLRIAVRRLRYAGEASRALLGRPGSEDLLRISRLQQVLGDHHDLAVLIARIKRAKLRQRRKNPDKAGPIKGFDRLIARFRHLQDGRFNAFERLLQGPHPLKWIRPSPIPKASALSKNPPKTIESAP